MHKNTFCDARNSGLTPDPNAVYHHKDFPKVKLRFIGLAPSGNWIMNALGAVGWRSEYDPADLVAV
jgi:hypothetical protein